MTKLTLPLILIPLLLLGALTPVSAQDGAAELLARVNSLRTSKGLLPYSVNGALAAAAANQAEWLANSGEVSHVQPDGSRPRDRAQAAGYASPWVGENIYVGMNASVDTAWDFWMNSPVHYAGMTSPNYSEIGIALVQGRSRSFVMVFGALPDAFGARPSSLAPGGAAGSAGGGGGDAAAPYVPPSFVIGVDAHGNIMHEVQEGDTLGDIALIYGYTWDVIPTVMALNAMTEEDIYGLDVGDAILVPPQDGTYTPTPMLETETPTPSPTPLEPTITTTPLTVALAGTTELGLLPVGTPNPVSPVSTTDVGLLPPATYVMPTATATATVTATRDIVVNTLPAILPTEPAPTAEIPPAEPPTTDNGRNLILVVAIGVQALVLGFAIFEFFRRRR